MSAEVERPNITCTRSCSGAFTRIRAGEGEEDSAVRYEFIASTDSAVEMWRSLFEILDHSPKAVRLDWFQSGNAPALWMHDREEIRGVIEAAKLQGGKLHVTVRMSSNEESLELIKDIDAGIIKNVSIGYRVFNEVIEKREFDEETSAVISTTWKATDWEPTEVSFVTVPADRGAGFGRSEDEVKSRVRFLESKAGEEAASEISQRDTTMSENAAPTITVEESNKSRTDAVNAERARIAGIHAAADAAREKGFGDFGKRALEAIEKNESLETFQRHVLDNMGRTETVTTADIGLTEKEAKRFSLTNILDGLREDNPKLYEFEKEVSDATRRAYGHQTRDGAICLPTDVALRGWYPSNPAFAARMGFGDKERTLISVSASTANVSNLVARELLADMFIESLRETSVLLPDVTILAGLVGDADIPIELLNPIFYWVGEDVEPTDGVWTASQVQFRFKTIAARISMTRRAMKQSTPQIEGVIARNLRKGCALGIEKQAWFGTGSSTVPTGILSTSGIGDVTSGGTLTFANILELRSDVASANAHTGNTKFYTSSKGISRFRGCAISANDAKRVAEYGADGQLYCEGRVVKETNLIPDTISTNKTGVLYGDPSSVYVGMWGGMELGVDTATKAATGGKTLRVFQDVDIQIPQPAHWSAIQDLT